jgi:hypothetical protein
MKTATKNSSSLRGWWLVIAMVLATMFVAGMTATAVGTGCFYILFPEMGALAQDVLTRPKGAWSNVPVRLVITPGLAAILGVLIVHNFSYGYLSVLLAVGSAVVVLKVLQSPIVPSLSAALLPVVFEERSWWYPLAVFAEGAILVLLSAGWKRFPLGSFRALHLPPISNAVPNSSSEQNEFRHLWMIPLAAFLVFSVLLVKLTGIRMLLFPPLAVVAFELFSKPKTCSWATKPLLVPLACFLTAMGGLCAYRLWGVSAITAAISMAWGFAVLYALKIHLPPAMAVGLIPLIIKNPTISFPISVGAGTLFLMMCHWCYRRFLTR